MKNILQEDFWFDVHSHLNHEKFDEDLKDIIVKMKQENVKTICIGCDKKSSLRAVLLAAENPETIYAAVGLHPTDAKEDSDLSWLEDTLKAPRVIGIGECGFDFYWSEKSVVIDLQEKVFRTQIDLALKYDLPIQLHLRNTKEETDAYQHALRVLGEYHAQGKTIKAHFHFFVGTKEQLEVVMKNGWYVSFGGVITFAKEYEELVLAADMDKVLIETDAPYLAPKAFRGKRCDPTMVIETGKKIAELKNLTAEEVRKITRENAQRLYGL